MIKKLNNVVNNTHLEVRHTTNKSHFFLFFIIIFLFV